jgi:NADH:ubiquinone oxidoreductase subunit 4 (subunit M)
VSDAALWRKTPFALLLAGLLVFGFFPRLLTDKIRPSADEIVSMLNTKSAPSDPGINVAVNPPALSHQLEGKKE